MLPSGRRALLGTPSGNEVVPAGMLKISQCRLSGPAARGMVSRSCMMMANAPVLAGAPVQDSAGDTGFEEAPEYLSGMTPPSGKDELVSTRGVGRVPGAGACTIGLCASAVVVESVSARTASFRPFCIEISLGFFG